MNTTTEPSTTTFNSIHKAIQQHSPPARQLKYGHESNIEEKYKKTYPAVYL